MSKQVYVLYGMHSGNKFYGTIPEAEVLGVFTDRALADEYVGVCDKQVDEQPRFGNYTAEVIALSIDDPEAIARLRKHIAAVKGEGAAAG